MADYLNPTELDTGDLVLVESYSAAGQLLNTYRAKVLRNRALDPYGVTLKKAITPDSSHAITTVYLHGISEDGQSVFEHPGVLDSTPWGMSWKFKTDPNTEPARYSYD